MASSWLHTPASHLPPREPLFANWALRLRHLLIIGAFLALTWVTGRLATSDKFPLFLGGPIAVIVLVVIAFRLNWGISMLLAATLFVQVGFSTGTQSPLTLSLVLSAALVGIWIARMMVEEKHVRLLPSPLNRPLIVFAVVAIASTIWSNLVRDPFVVLWDSFPRVQLGALSTMILSPAMALLVANTAKTSRMLKTIVVLFVLAGVVKLLVIYGPLKYFAPMQVRGLFPLWIIALSSGQAMFNESLPKWGRLGLGLIAGIWLFYHFVQHVSWVSGWLPPITALAVLAGLRSRKLLVGFAIVGLILIVGTTDFVSSTIQAESQESGTTREGAWETNWQFTREHLFLGMGPAGYAVYYMSYIPDRAMATHSNYIDILSQLGLLGAAAFVWLLVSTGWSAWQVTRKVTRGSFEHGLAFSLLAGYAGLIVAMALGDWFIPFAYTQGIAGYDYTVWGWIIVGMIMVLHRRYVIASSAETA